MFCKVTNKLKNKNPKVMIATLHLVMGKIAYVSISCLYCHVQKKCVLQILVKYSMCV